MNTWKDSFRLIICSLRNEGWLKRDIFVAIEAQRDKKKLVADVRDVHIANLSY